MRSVHVVQDQMPDLKILRIDFHNQFFQIRLSLRYHPNNFGSSEKWLGIEEHKLSKFVPKVGSAEQKHQWHPVIERVLHRFSVHLLIRGHIEINHFPIGYE